MARSTFYPRIGLTGSYGYGDRTLSSSRTGFPAEVNTLSKDALVGVTLNWNLFNGFRDRISLQNSRIAARTQELAYRDAINRLEGLLLEKTETFRQQKLLIQLEEQNVLAAEQNLQLQEDRYQIGTATFLEYRDAQVNLTRAQSTLIDARFQARITRLEIEQLTGELTVN